MSIPAVVRAEHPVIQTLKKAKYYKYSHPARHWWLTPVILATQEAEFRRMVVKASPGKWSPRPYLETNPSSKKKRAGGVAQAGGPEFKPQYYKKVNKIKNKQINTATTGYIGCKNLLLVRLFILSPTLSYLHFKKFLFIFLQCFNFLLRKRNYWLKLGVVVGLICILSGSVMVLMTVLFREGQRGDAAGPQSELASTCSGHPQY
jgi:hypothetical protein